MICMSKLFVDYNVCCDGIGNPNNWWSVWGQKKNFVLFTGIVGLMRLGDANSCFGSNIGYQYDGVTYPHYNKDGMYREILCYVLAIYFGYFDEDVPQDYGMAKRPRKTIELDEDIDAVLRAPI